MFGEGMKTVSKTRDLLEGDRKTGAGTGGSVSTLHLPTLDCIPVMSL